MTPYRLPQPPHLDPREWWVRTDPHLYQYRPGQYQGGGGLPLAPYRAPGPEGDWHYRKYGLPSIRNVNLGHHDF